MDPIDNAQAELEMSAETVLSVLDRLDLPVHLERKARDAVRLIREVRAAVGRAAVELATVG